jgi:polyisoprenyl-teichoic acid--peptidoglycan teichoic acid transferase
MDTFDAKEHDAHIAQPIRRPGIRRGILFFALFCAVFVFGAVLILNRLSHVAADQPILSVIKSFIHARDIPLEGEASDRINILLLGIGGAAHEGGLLADTIILASMKPSTGDVALLSIPRDLSVPSETYGWQKVNTIHAYAESTTPGTGGPVTAAILSNVLGVPIPYYLRIDFDGFEDLIDDVGGITVQVERRIDDPQYPIRGKELDFPLEERFEHLVIEPGNHKMDGEMALKYVRSRHTNSIEGSDFARAERQQNVLVAFKDKALSFSTFLNPIKIERILEDLRTHMATNMSLGDIARFADIGRSIDTESIVRTTLTDAPNGLLEARQIYGAYVLLPKDGSFNAIRTLVQTMIGNDGTVSTPLSTRESGIVHAATVEPRAPSRVAILNGTYVAGLAQQIARALETQGFVITDVGNASSKPQETTAIYRTKTAHETDERRLELFLNARAVDEEQEVDDVDFTIILGDDARIP